ILRPESPPEEDFYLWLGYDLSRPVPREIYLSLGDVEGHIGVFGSTGSGKSTTLQAIASRVPGMDVVVLDWTGEHARALAGRGFLVLDPREEGGFDVVRCSGGSWEEALEMLSRALELTEPQAYLAEQILRSGANSVRGMYEMIADIPEESKWDKEVKRGLARRLGTLLRSAGAALGGDHCFAPRGRVVLDLSGILETFSRRALANLVISTLFLRARSGGSGRILLVVDEAHNIVSGDGRDVMNAVLAESRKFGLHVAYATQSPSLMGDLALLNTNTKIVHAIKSQRDKRAIIDALGLGEDWMVRLDKLGRGVALLQSPSHPEPILVSIQP
ncbi:MAG: ATP-binding protein, partial [Desulfurococcales archaeon]|nr:ATP-binding protein [Desulfurococcales archaeon]